MEKWVRKKNVYFEQLRSQMFKQLKNWKQLNATGRMSNIYYILCVKVAYLGLKLILCK